jgi:hypothetical protein
MEQQITWTKGFFDSNYQLFSAGKIIGNLIFASWDNNAVAQDLTSTTNFKTTGFFNTSTNIINAKQEIIGVITYNSWQTKATIHMHNGEIYAWSFSNSWFNKWSITNFKEKHIQYQSHQTTGNITCNTTDEVMLQTGIFVREYFARNLAVILIVLFALFMGRVAV